ncbi:hypothetical protein [Pandoraea apista]|uniref:hypothetical protein n=1 Tax=Pandoraea apista TaxID=93218 RepID=UPI0015578D3A|nr:hypothetical protein [Pandoraea apista]
MARTHARGAGAARHTGLSDSSFIKGVDGISPDFGKSLGNFTEQFISGTAAAATTSVMRGGRIAIEDVAVDAFGNTVAVDLLGTRSVLGNTNGH